MKLAALNSVTIHTFSLPHSMEKHSMKTTHINTCKKTFSFGLSCILCIWNDHHSELWHCWLVDKKNIRPVKVLPQQFSRVYIHRLALPAVILVEMVGKCIACIRNSSHKLNSDKLSDKIQTKINTKIEQQITKQKTWKTSRVWICKADLYDSKWM